MTYNAVNRNVQHTIIDRYSDLASQQEILSTGKKLLRPSDAPIDVANDIKLRSKLNALTQLKKNINDGLGYMQVTDTAMMSMDSVMQRVRELAIEGSSDTLSTNERKYINQEVEQLLRQTVSLANTQFKGDYVFGGTQTKIEPYPLDSSTATQPSNYTNLDMAYYDGTGGVGVATQLTDSFDNTPITNIIPGSFDLNIAGVNYSEGTDYTIDYKTGTFTPLVPALAIDVSAPANYQYGQVAMSFEYITVGEDIYGDPVNTNGEVKRAIETGVKSTINITGDELMKDPKTGTDLLETIINLGQKLLENDTTGINDAIADIDLNMKVLLSAQSKNGARINRFETTLDRNDQQFTETTRRQSDLEDADMAEEIMKFSVMENAYNTALQSSAKIIQPSLVNYL